MSEEQVGHSILGSVSMHQNWKGESDEVHEDHLWRRGLRLWRRRHGGQLQVAEADILNEPNFDNNQQTFLLSPLYLHPSTPSPGLLALLAVVLWESPAKKGVILHRSLEKGPFSKESCFKLQASRWRTYFRKWCTMESFNMAPFLIHPSLDFNHLSFQNVFNRSQ